MVILFVLEYVIDASPDSLLLFRGIGYSATIFVITLIQFIPKIIFMFTDESSLDITNSSISETISGNQSQSYLFLSEKVYILFLNHI